MPDPDPVPPTNVRLVLADGREVPVQTTLAGVDDDGMALWEVVDPPVGRVRAMKVEVMPPRCSIGFPLAE